MLKFFKYSLNSYEKIIRLNPLDFWLIGNWYNKGDR